MVVDAGDTGVLYILFLVNVASRRYKEENLLKRWAFFLKAQYCHLAENTKTPILYYLRRLLMRRIKDQSS